MSYDRDYSLGDILAAAMNSPRKPMIEITLHSPKGMDRSRKISNIKALREATRIAPGDIMGLADAKAAIETIMDTGAVRLRLTPERYGHFMVNRHDLTDYQWQVRESRYVPPPVRETPVFDI